MPPGIIREWLRCSQTIQVQIRSTLKLYTLIYYNSMEVRPENSLSTYKVVLTEIGQKSMPQKCDWEKSSWYENKKFWASVWAQNYSLSAVWLSVLPESHLTACTVWRVLLHTNNWVVLRWVQFFEYAQVNWTKNAEYSVTSQETKSMTATWPCNALEAWIIYGTTGRSWFLR